MFLDIFRPHVDCCPLAVCWTWYPASNEARIHMAMTYKFFFAGLWLCTMLTHERTFQTTNARSCTCACLSAPTHCLPPTQTSWCTRLTSHMHLASRSGRQDQHNMPTTSPHTLDCDVHSSGYDTQQHVHVSLLTPSTVISSSWLTGFTCSVHGTCAALGLYEGYRIARTQSELGIGRLQRLVLTVLWRWIREYV